MKKITQGVTALLIVILCSLAYAAPIDKTPAAKPVVEAKAESTDTRHEEIVVLKAQVETMREFIHHILATVYWSLASVVVIAVVLVGFGWFTNYKLHERELTSLRQELMNSLESRVNAFSSDFTKKSQLSIEQLTAQSVNAATRKIEQSISSVRRELESCRQSISQLRIESLNAEARYWELKNIPANVFFANLRMLKLAIGTKSDTEIGSALESMRHVLEGGTSLYHVHIPMVVELMNSLPDKYSPQAEALRFALKDVKTY